MLVDVRVGQLPKMRPEPSVGAFLIRCYKMRVDRRIGGENGGHLNLTRSVAKAVLLNRIGQNGLSALRAHSNGKREGWHFLSVRCPFDLLSWRRSALTRVRRHRKHGWGLGNRPVHRGKERHR